MLMSFVQDVRFAFRAMKGRPLFTAMAVLSLALGIGANTAIYSFMDSILLRSLPVHDPASLVVLNWHAKKPKKPGLGDSVVLSVHGDDYDDPKLGVVSGIFPYAAFELFRKNDSIFSAV